MKQRDIHMAVIPYEIKNNFIEWCVLFCRFTPISPEWQQIQDHFPEYVDAVIYWGDYLVTINIQTPTYITYIL